MATSKKTPNKSTKISDDQHTIKSNVGHRADNKKQQVESGIAKAKHEVGIVHPKK